MKRIRLAAVASALLLAVGLAVLPPAAWSGNGDAAQDADEPSNDFIKRFKKAQLLLGSGKDAQAERALRELIAERPQQAEVHHALGVLLQFRKRPTEALAALLHAATVAPDDSIIRRDAGLEYLRHGRAAEALVHLEASAVLCAEDIETLNGLGLARIRTDRPAAAEQAFRAALEIEAGSIDALVGLAHARLAVDPEETRTILAPLPPAFADVRIVDGLALERLGKYEDASASLIRGARALAVHPASAPLFRLTAESLLRTGDALHASSIAERWVTAERADGIFAPGAEGARAPSLRALLCLARAQAALGEPAKALATLGDLAADGQPITPVLARARLVRAVLLLSAQAPHTASAALQELIERHPGSFEALAARHLAGDLDAEALLEAAKPADGARFGPLSNDAHWVLAVRAGLSGDDKARTQHARIGSRASKPPGEFPGALLGRMLAR